MKKQIMSVSIETQNYWNKSRYRGCVNDLAQKLNVTQRTINNALNHNYCTITNQIEITNFFKSKENESTV